jgi:hypothetical protein
MAEQWEPVAGGNAPFWKAKEVGDSISGKIVGKRTAPAQNGFKEQEIIDLLNKDGTFSVGLTADLKSKVGKLPLGTLVRIKYTGSQRIPGKPLPMKVYDVQQAKVS